MADEVGCTGLDGFEVGLAQVGLCHAAVALEGTHGGHQHAGRGSDTGVAALDIQKLLCAQIGTETGLSDGIVGQRKAQLGSQHAVAAVGDVGKGTAVDDGGVVSSVCTRFGSSASFSRAVMAPAAPISPAVTGLPS